VEGADQPRRGEVAAHGTHWTTSSSTSRRWSLGQPGGARGGGATDAEEQRERCASAEEKDDEEAKSQTRARRAVKKGRVRPLALNTGPAASAKCSPTRAHALAK
jgi:hypothetical protein